MASIINIGSEQQVSSTIRDYLGNPTGDISEQAEVTGLTDGGWVVTWHKRIGGGSELEIYQQRYDKNGQAVYPAEQHVNLMTYLAQSRPSITALADGGWVVVWHSYNPDGSAMDLSGDDIYQQRYDRDGQPLYSIEKRVNVRTDEGQFIEKVTSLSDGGWIVSWLSYDPVAIGLFQQRYTKDGQALFPYDTPANSSSDLTLLSDGTSIRISTEDRGTGSGSDVYMQRLNASGTPIDPDYRIVNKSTSGAQMSGKATALSNGGWVITWISTAQDGSGSDIYQQAYDKNGVAISVADLLVTSLTSENPEFPDVSALANGGWVVTWMGLGDKGTTEIFQQRFEIITPPHQIILNSSFVSEASKAGLLVGNLSALDQDTGETFTFSLVDSAGGRFKLGADGQSIVIANASLLDYEQARAHTIRLQVKDKAGEVFEQDLTVSISDVPNENVTGSSSSDVMRGGSGKDTFKGGAGNDLIYGGSGNDTIYGGVGSDRLWGGSGIDTLKGESGYDTFVFDTQPSTSKNRDKISDFNPMFDSLWLDNKVFTKLGKLGSIDKPAKVSKAYFATDKAKDERLSCLRQEERHSLL
ncbi:hypothetical protein ILT44_02335 [Microvirga sp. BT689]|uniref:calcium-binding protein n=1 Tax=Microvirga arvi TaxID=2778731 RepID=UPI00194F0CB4|nr:hypothetical protein [Microvirga arvi]MBM6579007.1 hypothetical protein [Microvirga arvi]